MVIDPENWILRELLAIIAIYIHEGIVGSRCRWLWFREVIMANVDAMAGLLYAEFLKIPRQRFPCLYESMPMMTRSSEWLPTRLNIVKLETRREIMQMMYRSKLYGHYSRQYYTLIISFTSSTSVVCLKHISQQTLRFQKSASSRMTAKQQRHQRSLSPTVHVTVPLTSRL